MLTTVEQYRRAPICGARKKTYGNIRTVLTPCVYEYDQEVGVVFEREATSEHFICTLDYWKKDPPVDKTLNHALNLELWAQRPPVASRWKHYKGGVYAVVTNAFDIGSGDHYIVYRSEDDGIVWARPITEWTSTLVVNKKTVWRFGLIV